MWLLAAFSSVTGLDTDLSCDSEGLHGSHTAGLCLAMQQNRQARVRHVPGSSICGSDTKFWLDHAQCHPMRKRLEQRLLAGLVKGCTIHPECKNKQCWSTQ